MSAFTANPHFQPVSCVATMNSVTPRRPQYTCTWPSYEYNVSASKKGKKTCTFLIDGHMIKLDNEVCAV